jgi:hypothetical protein
MPVWSLTWFGSARQIAWRGSLAGAFLFGVALVHARQAWLSAETGSGQAHLISGGHAQLSKLANPQTEAAAGQFAGQDGTKTNSELGNLSSKGFRLGFDGESIGFLEEQIAGAITEADAAFRRMEAERFGPWGSAYRFKKPKSGKQGDSSGGGDGGGGSGGGGGSSGKPHSSNSRNGASGTGSENGGGGNGAGSAGGGSGNSQNGASRSGDPSLAHGPNGTGSAGAGGSNLGSGSNTAANLGKQPPGANGGGSSSLKSPNPGGKAPTYTIGSGGAASHGPGSNGGTGVAVPEIDPTSFTAALTLLIGGLLCMTGRKTRTFHIEGRS